MARDAVSALAPEGPEPGTYHAVIETPKGSRNKYKHDEKLGLFRLDKVLPAGAVFPFDFGYIPATRGGDGDPLDVLVLADEPAFPGCLITVRLAGVVEAEQSKAGKMERNDRLIAVADQSRNHRDVKTLDDLSPSLLEEIQHFFVSYHELGGSVFRVLGCSGPDRAETLIRDAKQSSHTAGA